MSIDRDSIREKLAAKHHTWRWNGGDRTRYEAVETTPEGLRWFRWSHDIEGPEDEVAQSFEAFLEEGPPRAVPKSVTLAVKRWIEGLR